jgi:STE24 endopeptidase
LSRPGSFGKVLLGAAAGFTLAYTAVRAAEALAERRTPSPPHERDPHAYGATRRALTLIGFARSTAGIGIWAFALAAPAERALGFLPRALRLPAFSVLVGVVDTLRDWPIDFVEEYVLERAVGNSDRRIDGWVADRVKALAVTAIAGSLFAAFADQMMHRAPRRWPWIAIAATPPLLAFVSVIIPTFVMPLFNKYVPLEGELEQRIRTLAARYGVGDAQILRFDMSRQTKKANAFVTGVFGTERIALADTLVEAFQPDETLFVVAHELGHYVRRDPWMAIGVGTVALATTLLGALSTIRRSGAQPGDSIAGTMRLAFYATVFQFALLPATNGISRAIERRADRFALAATGDAQSGVRAFERLRDQDLAEDEPPKWAELLLSSHPSLRSRIAALRSAVSGAT